MDDRDDGAGEAVPAIAGHPLVRVLRRTADREVWVAADATGAGVELHRSRPGEEALLAREVEALLLADHPHLVPVADVATDGGVVVVRPLLPVDLAGWLVARGAPAAGEAVTVLAPIASALAALHAVGASMGGLAAQHVRLDTDGAPLLTGEGARVESSRPSPAWREGSAGVAADASGWLALAEAVLGASGEAVPDGVRHAVDARDLEAASRALLAAWGALPLALEPGARAASPVVSRIRRRERAEGVEAVWARVALVVERIAARVPRLGHRADGAPTARAAQLLRGVALVRPRFWAVGGAGAAAVAVMLLLPAPGAADVLDRAPSRDGSTAVPSAASPSTEPRAATAPQAQHAPSPTVPDDPVVGAAMLLAEREACLDADDAACLVALHEPDSPQLTATAPWRMPDDARLEVVQRLGDAWLLRVVSDDEPASVLVMSSEAGWTLRDAWVD